MMGVAESILNCIGNTPAVWLKRLVPASSARICVKLEFFNPTGSYKDRAALAMMRRAEERGELRPGMRVVEFTAGNTGAALAMVCAIKGYRFSPVTSDVYSPEKVKAMSALGAEPIIVPGGGCGISSELVERLRATAEAEAMKSDVFYADQFSNADAIEGGEEVGRELLAQLNGELDVFCAGVGTSALLVGVARALRSSNCGARVVALEPASAPTLTTGKRGTHRIDGVAAGFVPRHLHDIQYEARAIEESVAREVARRLAVEEGILAGTSTGMNVAAALDIAAALGSGHTVATVAVDTGLKYVNSDLYCAG